MVDSARPSCEAGSVSLSRRCRIVASYVEAFLFAVAIVWRGVRDGSWRGFDHYRHTILACSRSCSLSSPFTRSFRPQSRLLDGGAYRA